MLLSPAVEVSLSMFSIHIKIFVAIDFFATLTLSLIQKIIQVTFCLLDDFLL
jgi:hypothetical protein